MLRNLLDEVRRRRLWPIAALAVIVAIVAPLLFLKSAPEDAPSADSAAPAAAEAAKLPPRAARLLAATDAGAAGGRAKGDPQDPFNPPASYRDAAGAAAPGAGGADGDSSKSSGGGSAPKPIPVVIKNGDGSSTKSNGSSRTTTTPSDDRPSSNTTNRSSDRTYTVDVRFGKKADTKIRRAIPRMKGFYIHGKLVAVFVKYSPSRGRAVFAVAPGLHISGPVKCRVKDGACRYLDIPAGSHAWLTMVTPNRTIVRRRLDVVRAESHTTSIAAKSASAGARATQACLLGKLVAMERGDALLTRDACQR